MSLIHTYTALEYSTVNTLKEGSQDTYYCHEILVALSPCRHCFSACNIEKLGGPGDNIHYCHINLQEYYIRSFII